MPQKSHGSGNLNSSHKYSSSKHQKSGSKRNPNGPPPYPMSLPYPQPPPQPVFPAMVPSPRIALPGYPFPPVPAPFPGVEHHLVKSGSETPPMQPFVPTVNGQPIPRPDPNGYVVNVSNRRPNVQDSGGQLNQAWRHQRTFGPRGNIPLQQGMGPRPIMVPPFYAPVQGFMVGSNFPGNLLPYPLPIAYLVFFYFQLCAHRSLS